MALPPVSRPSAAFADLRAFLASRERHQWVFALLSVLITGYFITVFLIQSKTKEYKPPEIVWVKDYAANRTDAEIRAQQRIDQAKRLAEEAELKKLQEAQRRDSAKLQKKLRELGI
jgi:hypothetical protein